MFSACVICAEAIAPQTAEWLHPLCKTCYGVMASYTDEEEGLTNEIVALLLNAGVFFARRCWRCGHKSRQSGPDQPVICPHCKSCNYLTHRPENAPGPRPAGEVPS